MLYNSNGALKGVDCTKIACKCSYSSLIVTTRVPNTFHGVNPQHIPSGPPPPSFGPTIYVRLALGDGATMLHAVSVYGIVRHCETKMALWEDVLYHLSGLGNALHIIGSDSNFLPWRPRDVPQTALAHPLTRWLVDLDLEYVRFEERCQCGYMLGGGNQSHTLGWRASKSLHRVRSPESGPHQ